jgi:hypothetical protein
MQTAHLRNALGLGFMIVTGCSAARTTQVPPEYPRSEQVLCHYVGLQASTRPTEQNQDMVSMLAVYRFSEPSMPPPDEPLTLTFQVDRSRVDELREHLERQPDVICSPDANARHQPRVKPFVPSVSKANKPQTAPNGEVKAPAAALQPSAADERAPSPALLPPSAATEAPPAVSAH